MLLENLNQLVGSDKHTLPTDARQLRAMSDTEMKQAGLNTRQMSRVRAALKIASAIAEPEIEYNRIRVTSPAKAIEFCREHFKELLLYGQQEEFWLITLDTKNQFIAKHQITVGTLRNSLVHPREVFRPAIKDSANCIIVVHNHPSGDPTPSDMDISVTERLESAAEIIGIPVLDHIVVAREKCISIQEWRSGNKF